MKNLCLFGAGRMAQDHARNIQRLDGVRLYAVVDPDSNASGQMAQKYSCKQLNADQAFADDFIDAVAIVSPSETHSELLIRAATAKKAIFCEKPIDLNLGRIDECLAEVSKAEVPLLLAFNRRFDPSFRALKESIASGFIGEVESVHITSRDCPVPGMEYLRTSGGMFHDMTVHDFDMARWLLGEEPVRVFATGSCLVNQEIAEIGDIDTAQVILETSSGRMCQISNSRRSAFGYDQRLEVFGSKGMLRAHNLPSVTTEYSDENGCHSANPHYSFPQRYQEAYFLEMQHFCNEVMHGRAPYVTGEDGRKATMIANAATESLRTKMPVEIGLS